jgi:hypothetical protein
VLYSRLSTRRAASQGRLQVFALPDVSGCALKRVTVQMPGEFYISTVIPSRAQNTFIGDSAVRYAGA